MENQKAIWELFESDNEDSHPEDSNKPSEKGIYERQPNQVHHVALHSDQIEQNSSEDELKSSEPKDGTGAQRTGTFILYNQICDPGNLSGNDPDSRVSHLDPDRNVNTTKSGTSLTESFYTSPHAPDNEDHCSDTLQESDTHQQSSFLELNKVKNTSDFPETLHLNYRIEKQKYNEDESTPEWYNHKLHVLIFTYSGKPVYTRYGSEERITSFTGTLSAILSTMQSLFDHSEDPDALRYIKAGKYIFAFIHRGPLWLAAISSKGEFFSQMEALLNNVHLQIVSLLTRAIEQVLTTRPSYDVRPLLGGTQGVIYNYISWHLNDMFSLVKGYEPLPLSPVARSVCLNILKDVQLSNILAGILFARHRIVGLTVSKSTKIPPSDIILLLNLVLSLASLRQAESWMPVCLPGINDGAFLHAYVNFLTTDTVGLIFISTNSDPEQFYALSQHYKRIKKILSSSSCLTDIHASIRCSPLEIAPHLAPLEIIHMLFYSTSLQQYFSSKFELDHETKEKKQRVFRLYSQCSFLIRNLKPPSHLYLSGETESAYIWKLTDFHLYVCVPRWKTINTPTLTAITDWIKSNFNTFFITSIPFLNP